jgi:phosphopentomutase
MVETNSILQGKTTIIITADHGGYQTQHDTATNPLNFTIPFIVWGKGVSPRSDLYILNTSSRVSPNATTNPAYTGIQPIRNGDAGNLALHLLGLGPIPNSMINNNQDLKVQGVRTCKPWN